MRSFVEWPTRSAMWAERWRVAGTVADRDT